MLPTTVLMTWMLAGEPFIAPSAHAELGVVVREPALDQPGITVAVPPSAAAGLGVGLVVGRREAGPHAWMDGGVVSSVGGHAIESLADGTARIRPARSQMVRASFGVVLAPHPQVQVGFGLGYALRMFTSPMDERIPAQLMHAPQVVMPLVFTSQRGRVAFRLRPAIGPSLSARDIGLAVGVGVDLDLRLIGSLALRFSAREDHDLYFPLHDAQHLATVALVFDKNPWKRPRP
jgi:hypothetical protein